MSDIELDDENNNDNSYNQEYLDLKNNLNQSNSILIKSFDEEKFNYTDIIKHKTNLNITFPNNNTNKILTKSIKKICSLIVTETNNLESIYSQYITAIINEDEENTSAKDNLLNNNNEVLDETYMKLLDNTKYYYIGFPEKKNNIKNELLNYDININKVLFNSKSLKKVFKMMNKNLYAMSDFINILLLNTNEADFFQNKILDKYVSSDIGSSSFIGIKFFNCNLAKAVKNNKSNLSECDKIFNNVMNHIEELIVGEDEKESEDLSYEFEIPKIDIKEDSKSKQDEGDKKNRYNMGCRCGQDFCEICNIF